MRLAYRTEKNAKAIAAFWGKSLEKENWFEIKSQSGENEAEILIYDVLGWPWLEAQEFVRELDGLDSKDVLVRINSPGGDVIDTMAIFNALESYKGKVTMRIESLAASSASIIALAGKEVQAYKNAMFMIHEPWTFAFGDQYEFREVADLLEKISRNMIDIYAANSNVGKKDIKDMMKAETWFTAKEAKEKGFINTIIDGKSVKANFDLSMFAHVPDGWRPEGRELTKREIEQALRDGGASHSFAKAVASGRSNGDDLREVESLKLSIEQLTTNLRS